MILSSDDAEIIEIAKKAGTNVPFVRPSILATDTTSSIDVVLHALEFMEQSGFFYDAVCLLQPTSPVREEGFIDNAIEKFINKNTDSLLSVLQVPHEYNPHWTFEENIEGNLKIATGDNQIISRRQDLPKAYFRDGSIYISNHYQKNFLHYSTNYSKNVAGSKTSRTRFNKFLDR